MTCLKPFFCTRFSGSVSYEHVVVVSDSALDLPGVMYGLACLLREHKLNLLWLVSKPGAGAKELAAVWDKAPRCAFGLKMSAATCQLGCGRRPRSAKGQRHDWSWSNEGKERKSKPCELRRVEWREGVGVYGVRAPPKTSLEAKITQDRCR